jgi:UDP-glucuronate 4-epimerase
MRVLITGGAGFIGSHVAEALLRDRHAVIIVDDLNDYYSPHLKRENLDAIRLVGPFRFDHCDICDADAVFRIVEETRPDAILHLAARAGVRPSLEQPLLYAQVNVCGTTVLLEAARRGGVKKFVFASSSSIYGAAQRVPFSEEDPLNLPISPYAATKLAGEKICYTYSHLYRLSMVCLRFFTVYGPRQRPDLAIRKFTEMIDQGRRIDVFGDGTTSRDYTFVDDTVQGILAALRYDCAYEIFNLGNSHPIPLADLIEAIEMSLGKKANLRRLPDQPGDVPITYADISKAQRLLGYSPATPFRAGIRKFVEWYLSRTRPADADWAAPGVELIRA